MTQPIKRPNPDPFNLRLAQLTPKWAQQQTARRRLVVLMYLSPLLALLLRFTLPISVFDNLASGLVAGLVIAILILTTLVCWAWVAGSGYSIKGMPDKYLDEREYSRINDCYRLSYLYLSSAIIIFAVYLFTASIFAGLHLPFPQLKDTNWWFWTLYYPTVSLPNAIYAWSEPDQVIDG
jgi:hypothetical protein